MVPVIANSSPIVAVDVDRVLAAPIVRMEHETAPGLDRSAVMNGAIGRFAGVDIELAEQARGS